MRWRWIEHPLTRGLDLDDPRTTHLRREVLQQKTFLRDIYVDWYRTLAAAVPEGDGAVLEIGSGAGFLADIVPDLITSDTFPCEGVRVALDAQLMPFAPGSLRAIMMTNVLHHLPEPKRFFAEATACVRPGGVVVMVEPWVTRWSRLVYTRLHHEPFLPDAAGWSFSSTGPLSGANGALPWIVFQRDRAKFERDFPVWSIEVVEPMMPFRYLVSGGVSLRNLMPAWATPVWSGIERLLRRQSRTLGMFAYIVLRRT